MTSIKQHRINSQKMFDAIFKNGSKIAHGDLVLRFLESSDDQNRHAFLIPKKTGNAPFRNQIRRILRQKSLEFFDKQNQKYWFVFRCRPNKADGQVARLKHSAEKILGKIK